MDRKLSDEQLDRIAKDLLSDFALDDEPLDEIAESPRLWWSVRNHLEAERARREKSWLAAFRWPIPVFGALAIVLCFGLTALFLNSKNDSNQPVAKENPLQNRMEEKFNSSDYSTNVLSSGNSEKPEISKNSVSKPAPEKVSVKNIEPKPRFVTRNQTVELSTKQLSKSSKKTGLPKPTEETKTDFIALSYAANSESGQIVRVKVPSSMMVSLGLATNVEKESELVSAEVIIGDDGLARAIRFIR